MLMQLLPAVVQRPLQEDRVMELVLKRAFAAVAEEVT